MVVLVGINGILKKRKRSGGVHIREDSEEVAVGKCETDVSNSHL